MGYQIQPHWPESLRAWFREEIPSCSDTSARKRSLVELASNRRLHRVAERLSAEERRFASEDSTLAGEMPGGTVRIINFMMTASKASDVWALQKKLAAQRPALERTRDGIASLLKLMAEIRQTILFGMQAWNYDGSRKAPEDRLAVITDELNSLERICDGLTFYYPEGGDALPANNKKTFCIRYLKWRAFGSGLDLRDQDIADTVSVVSGLEVTEDDVRKAWKSATAYMRRPSDIPM